MKRLLAFLHGSWLGHPLHPGLVHLPMGLWPAALLFDVLSRLAIDDGALAQASFYAILLGLVGALLAIPAGLADWLDVGRDKVAWKLGLYHMILNLVITALWLINLLLRARTSAGPTPLGPLTLSAVATFLLVISGYLGGRMTFGQGTYVGWMARARWRRMAEAGGARVPEEKG